MTNTVIILDGEQRAALAVARSLGRRGLRIIVCSVRSMPLAGASRWCSKTYVVPDARENADDLAPALETIASDEGASLIFPITDTSVTALNYRPVSGQLQIASPPISAYHSVSDKGELVRLAKSLGVPVPKSIIVTTPASFEESIQEWGGRIVIKPAFSRFLKNGRICSTAVTIVENRDEALALLPTLNWFGSIPCVLQEFVPGSGAGVFTVYGNNASLTWFSHRRIREKPPTGGVSVLSQSVPPDPTMRSYAQMLLNAAGWSGPAMVEFRVDETGTPWLMEINGRFWGSLQLAIDCGIDMPWLWYQAVTSAAPTPVDAYIEGQRLRWLLGDLDSLYLTMRRSDISLGKKLLAIRHFLNFFSRRTRLEVFRLADVRPFIRELKDWIREIFWGTRSE